MLISEYHLLCRLNCSSRILSGEAGRRGAVHLGLNVQELSDFRLHRFDPILQMYQIEQILNLQSNVHVLNDAFGFALIVRALPGTFQLDCREVQKAANSRLHHGFEYAGGGAVWNTEDSDADLVFYDKIRKLRNIEYRNPGVRIEASGIGIEAGDDADSFRIELTVVKQRCADLAASDNDDSLLPTLAEDAGKLIDKVVDGVAAPFIPLDMDRGEVLPDHSRGHSDRISKIVRKYLYESEGTQLVQHSKVSCKS